MLTYDEYITKLNELFKIIEDYSLADLKTMINLEPRSSGGCGYPIVLMTCTLMEMIGVLMSGKEYCEAFKYTFIQMYPNTNLDTAGKLYKDVRCSLAHKGLLSVGYYLINEPELHLYNNKIISPKHLYKHFIAYYNSIKISIRNKKAYHKHREYLEELLKGIEIHENHFFSKITTLKECTNSGKPMNATGMGIDPEENISDELSKIWEYGSSTTVSGTATVLKKWEQKCTSQPV